MPQIAPPPTGSMVEIGPNGLPVIRGNPKAPAARMSAKKLLQLAQAAQAEEDVQRAGLAA